jgi:hypothetical protein
MPLDVASLRFQRFMGQYADQELLSAAFSELHLPRTVILTYGATFAGRAAVVQWLHVVI